MSAYVDDHSFIKAFKPIDHKILTECELNIKRISDWMHQNRLKMNNGKNRAYNILNKIIWKEASFTRNYSRRRCGERLKNCKIPWTNAGQRIKHDKIHSS